MTEISKTELALLAVHKSPVVKLQDIYATYVNTNWPETLRRAGDGTLPFPVFRMADHRKAPWLVRLSDLAEHIDRHHADASERWQATTGDAA